VRQRRPIGEIDFLGTLTLTLTSPEDDFIADDAAVASGERLQSIAVRSETIDPTSSDPDLQSPGTYYLRLALEEQGDPSEEFPVEIVVDVTGEAVEPTPTEEPPPADEDDLDQAAPDGTSTSSNNVMLAVGGIAFGLLGAAVGALAGRRVAGAR
jgi:hypothetical protein